jgi:PEGA domain
LSSRSVSVAPVSSGPPAGSARITTIGLGASQPMFSTRNTALDSSPGFPWAAIVAVAAAGLVVGGVIGGVIGYNRGIRSVQTVASGVTTSAPGSRTTTDVPVTSDPAPKPVPTPPVAPESRPASPTATAEKPEDRPATAATRVADVRGRIVVRSTPSGAIVRVDGRLQGETPITIRDLTLGAHTVQVARPGFVPFSDRIVLSRATPSQTVAVQLEQGSDSPQATAGSVFVDSRPRGARVTIDGRDAGVTPLQIPEVTLGRHTVSLELAGFKGISTEIMVRPGPTAKVAITLEQIR